MNIFATSRFNLHRLGLPMAGRRGLVFGSMHHATAPCPQAGSSASPAGAHCHGPARGACPPTSRKPSRPVTTDAMRPAHLYEKNMQRVFHGKMPPLLYAVGVLQVEVDGKGRVTSTSWMRPPLHAPEVMAEIERTVRLAAPYPAPVRMGRVTYTDTWLWHKSGLFQLDTLTEGQL